MINIKICGIICEYNPLHRGHAYQISEARKISDAVVCIMSGNFVQRGENAIFDKYKRAECAIKQGADAVFELPQIFALQSAEHFAAGSVLSASKIGCDFIFFGSESDDISILENTVENKTFEQSISSGISYGNALDIFSRRPNAMLGHEYIKAIKKYSLPLEYRILKRQTSYLSASNLREELKSGNMHSEILCNASPLFPEKFFDLIKYSIATKDIEELREICGVNEGLEYKLKKELAESQNLDFFIKSVKSKRYTYSRISRILFCSLLNVKKEHLKQLKEDPPALKLLAINKEKTHLLSKLKNFYVSPLDAKNFSSSTALSNEKNLLASTVYGIKSDNFCGNEDFSPCLIKI